MRTRSARVQRVAHARDPPREALGGHRVPAVQRVAPALAGGREEVGRHAGHHRAAGRAASSRNRSGRAQQSALWWATKIGRSPTIVHALGVGVGLQRAPLRVEAPLHEVPEVDLGGVLRARGGERRRLAAAPAPRRPARPGPALLGAVLLVERHEQRVVVEPVRLRARDHAAKRGALGRRWPARRSRLRPRAAGSCATARRGRSRRGRAAKPRSSAASGAAEPAALDQRLQRHHQRRAGKGRRRSGTASCRGRPASSAATATALWPAAGEPVDEVDRQRGRSRRMPCGPGSEVRCSRTPASAFEGCRSWRKSGDGNSGGAAQQRQANAGPSSKAAPSIAVGRGSGRSWPESKRSSQRPSGSTKPVGADTGLNSTSTRRALRRLGRRRQQQRKGMLRQVVPVVRCCMLAPGRCSQAASGRAPRAPASAASPRNQRSWCSAGIVAPQREQLRGHEAISSASAWAQSSQPIALSWQ